MRSSPSGASTLTRIARPRRRHVCRVTHDRWAAHTGSPGSTTRRRRRDRLQRVGGEPARGLTPEPVVAAIGCRAQHLPSPARLPGKQRRAPRAETLHGDHRRMLQPAHHGQHRRAGPRRRPAAHARPATAVLPIACAPPRRWRRYASSGAACLRRSGARVPGPRPLVAAARTTPPPSPRRSGSSFFERRTGDPCASNVRAPAKSNPPPRSETKCTQPLQLLARQRMRVDIGEYHDVVRESASRVAGNPFDQRFGSAPPAWTKNVSAPCSLRPLRTAASTSSDGSSDHARLRNVCSKPGAPSSDEHQPASSGRWHEHASLVVRRGQLSLFGAHIDGVQGGRLASRRDREQPRASRRPGRDRHCAGRRPVRSAAVARRSACKLPRLRATVRSTRLASRLDCPASRRDRDVAAIRAPDADGDDGHARRAPTSSRSAPLVSLPSDKITRTARPRPRCRSTTPRRHRPGRCDRRSPPARRRGRRVAVAEQEGSTRKRLASAARCRVSEAPPRARCVTSRRHPAGPCCASRSTSTATTPPADRAAARHHRPQQTEHDERERAARSATSSAR